MGGIIMATCCDMKSCSVVFAEGQAIYRTRIGDYIYKFCDECRKGLQAFVDDKLHTGSTPAIDENGWINIPIEQFKPVYPHQMVYPPLITFTTDNTDISEDSIGFYGSNTNIKIIGKSLNNDK